MAEKKLRKEQVESPEGTDILSTGETGGTKFLREDGDGTCSWQTPPAGGTVDVVSNVATSTIIGRVTAGSGDSEELTATQVRTLLNVADGAEANAVDSVAGETGVISAVDLRTAINVADGADVTNATNVEAAGALMDSEVTNLAQVKAFDSSDYATAAQGSLANSAVQDLSDLGITATAAELNYTDGVTSNIQTQLNAKAPTANPTFTGIVTYPQSTSTVSALGDLGATETIDWATATRFTGTLDSNVTITHSNEVSGRSITLYLAYDDAAQRTITWSGVDVWLDNNDGSAPVTPSSSGEELVVTMDFVGTTCYASATGNYPVYA